MSLSWLIFACLTDPDGYSYYAAVKAYSCYASCRRYIKKQSLHSVSTFIIISCYLDLLGDDLTLKIKDAELIHLED